MLWNSQQGTDHVKYTGPEEDFGCLQVRREPQEDGMAGGGIAYGGEQRCMAPGVCAQGRTSGGGGDTKDVGEESAVLGELEARTSAHILFAPPFGELPRMIPAPASFLV